MIETKRNKDEIEQGRAGPSKDAITLDPADVNSANSWEELISLWTISKEAETKSQWVKGDITLKIAGIYGEQALRKFAQEVGEKLTTLEHYRRVSRAFPHGKRNYNMTWTHYLLASFTDSYKKDVNMFQGNSRFDWAEKASDGGWTTPKMQQEIKKSKAIVDDTDYLPYYMDYINKMGNVLTHCEKDKLTKEDKQRLADRLLEIYNKTITYLLEE